MVVCVNHVDIARQKGIVIDIEKLSAALKVPVVAAVAPKGKGLHELMEKAVEISGKPVKTKPREYGAEVEKRIKVITEYMES